MPSLLRASEHSHFDIHTMNFNNPNLLTIRIVIIFRFRIDNEFRKKLNHGKTLQTNYNSERKIEIIKPEIQQLNNFQFD